MWKYLFFCFAMLVWAFFELSGGQDFEPAMATSVSEVSKPTDDAEPIDRSIDRLIEKKSRVPQQTLCAVLNLMITLRRQHTSML